ncbi:MAG: gliding motility-associated C-terminal domain-containing protein [Bacteroidales bacterium]|jgi:gliding motility-associated-like protein|nr:gliding motility-associated C-terminal domain-containing protein [Bacteroidales bacterium]NPV35590.1 gliding motility-associated C-terminal domain-containing protein [Bacteroidales bacterium]
MNPDFDIGKFFKERINDYSETPPEGLWEKIADKIPANPKAGRPATSSSVKYYYFAAGSMIVGLTALMFYLFTATPSKTNSSLNDKGLISNPTNPPAYEIKKIATESKPTTATTHPNLINHTSPTVNKSKKLIVAGSTLNTQQPVSIVNNPLSETGFNDENLIQQNNQPNVAPEPNTNPVAENLTPKQPIEDSIQEPEDLNKEPSESSLYTEQIVTACRGEELILNAGEGTGHRWSTGQTGQSINYQATDETTLTVDYTDLQGRKVTGIFNISLLNCSVFVPRAFSPNDDGHNDFYRIKAEGISNFEMKIFSKWGEMVFHSRDPEAGWDGKQKGNPASAGIYIYQINYTDPNNQTRAIFGTLTLLR